MSCNHTLLCKDKTWFTIIKQHQIADVKMYFFFIIRNDSSRLPQVALVCSAWYEIFLRFFEIHYAQHIVITGKEYLENCNVQASSLCHLIYSWKLPMQVKLSISLRIPWDKQQVRIILRLLDIFSLILCISIVYLARK